MSGSQIHPTAIIGPEVELASDVVVGPYSIIRGKTKIGPGCKIESHAVVGSDAGTVELGAKNWIFPGSNIGGAPQDLSYKGESTSLIVGSGNTFRECVTLNLGTTKGGGVTKLGNNNLLMAYTHVGHDCQFGNSIVIANSCQFAGHVEIEDNVRIGGVSAVAQFCRVGRFAYLGGYTVVNKDIIPYSIAQGNFAVCRATNKIGLERAGYSKDEVNKVNKAIRYLTKGDRTLQEALALIEAELMDSELVQSLMVQSLMVFIKKSEGGLAR
jgi:UDP-N-acetylglucosamine acyltransferase